ncbi:MAG: hypothetical protein GY795_40850 [Desulfobacterales bacterium]|nr:hypothetical protein [Desulfobacterales bacterium]
MYVYLGTFLIALTTLALEITLTRLLSVITWYHLSFFAIATGMLGMTAGATTVYLKPNWFTQEKVNNSVIKACMGYSLVSPITLIMLCMMPFALIYSVMSIFVFMMATIICSLPFYFSGIVITSVLTKYRLPVGKIYASDLIGASLGCLFVLVCLEKLDAPSLILLCSAVGILAGLCFAKYNSSLTVRYFTGWLFLILILSFSAVINSYTFRGIAPMFVKGKIEIPDNYMLKKWNSFSRVAVLKGFWNDPQYWGASPLAPRKHTAQFLMNIDGDACTALRRFSSLEDIEHLRFDVTNIAYYLRSQGGACIIGAGGGRDIQSALLFGHNKVVGIDVNPIFIRLLQNEFRKFAGIADREEVSLIIDEARSFLSRTEDKYSVIQMSLIDTWAATGAGAFSLSENALYTVEAWQVFFNRLAEDGIFTVSRWYNPHNIGETGRIASLAVAALLQSGVKKPSQHIIMVTSGHISTLLLNRNPFSKQDIAQLKKVCDDLKYNIAVLPDVLPDNDALKKIISVRSRSELNSAIADEVLNYEPPTDENPYFFNMLRLKYLSQGFKSEDGIVSGNLSATLTLIGIILSLSLVTLATIIIPLLKDSFEKNKIKVSQVFWYRALYFSLIGAGFMFIEIALIQRLSVFLGHPVYALGVLLFTIIASAGIGSFLSEHLPLTQFPWIFISPVVMASAILLTEVFLPVLISNMIPSAMIVKIVVSVVVICPLGILMGFFFPTGMRLVNAAGDTETSWYWALNGIFGVLCSALAVFFSIYFGISMNFYLGAICYTTLLICVCQMYKDNQHPVSVT